MGRSTTSPRYALVCAGLFVLVTACVDAQPENNEHNSVADIATRRMECNNCLDPPPPGPENTGVPAGEVLVAAQTDAARGIEVDSAGNVRITMSGAFSNLLIQGRLELEANDVTIRNTRILANPVPWDLPSEPTTTAQCQANGNNAREAVTSYNRQNIVIEDSEIAAENPSVYIGNGIHGSGYTLRRVDISGTVDGAGIFNASAADVVIEDSYVHDLYTGQWSFPHGCDEPSHTDGIQIHFGSNITIRNNTIRANSITSYSSTSAILITQGSSYYVSDVTIEGNVLDYGSCSINVHDSDKTPTITDLSIVGNAFGKHQSTSPNCAMIIRNAVVNEPSNYIGDNTWEDGSTPDPTITNGG